MDLHQRKSSRIALPGTDLNVRSCIPAFYPPGKQSCSIPSKDTLIPIQHSSCSTQVFSFDQGPPPPHMLAHETLTQHQDIEYITLPVYKTRKNEAPQHYAPSDLSILDARFHQESNTTLDLRTIQNLSYSTVPEQHPSYFCLAQSGMRPRNQIHQDSQNFMAFQPPPRSPRREPTARALVSQHNSHYSSYADKDFDSKCDDGPGLYYPKNLMMNIPGRRPTSEVQLPIPFQWVEVNKQKINQNSLMKPIPEKIESSHHSYRRCQDYEMFPDKQHLDADSFKRQDNYVYPANKKFTSDPSFNKHSNTELKSPYKMSKKKCFHNREDYVKKNGRDGSHPDSYMSPLNFSTTSHSSLESLSHYSTQRSRVRQCSCSGDSDQFSGKEIRKSKRSVYSVANQTEFLKSPLEEKFLFRETILLGCDEIGKWARKIPMVSEISEMGDYIREKTTQSRAQNICSALGLEVEDQVIVSGYLKVFLKIADSWLEARNCFGLTDNCMKKACQLNNPEISQNYLEWQLASRRLLGNIIHGVGSVLTPKDASEADAHKMDCRLSRSTSNLQKYCNQRFSKRPFLQRQKWTISDTASTTSQSSSILNPPKYSQNVESSESHPITISDLPQHKIIPLSQIEPPCLRKQDNRCPPVDFSAWFAGRSADGSVKDSQLSNKQKSAKSGVQKSQSVTVVYAADGSQDSSDDIQQKIYMKPGSYNVPKKKLTNAKKRNNVQKAKEACCGDTDIPRGYVIPFVNAGPFVPPPSRGLQNPNIKIVKNENLLEFAFKSDEGRKIAVKDDDKELCSEEFKDNSQDRDMIHKDGNLKQSKVPSKTMKTDEWILTTLMNSRALRKSDENEKIQGQEKFEGNDASQASQASSDKSSHGLEENVTNRSQSSITSRSLGKISKTNSKMWLNSKRRRMLSQPTSVRIEEVVSALWNCDMPDYLKQAVKLSQFTDYYKIVKYPVFLETITNKVKNGIYETIEQFIHDSRRLIFNSSLYFKEDKAEIDKIEKFSVQLEKLMQDKFDNCDCWNHITGDPKEIHFFPELRYSNICGIGKKRSKTPKNGPRKEEKFYE